MATSDKPAYFDPSKKDGKPKPKASTVNTKPSERLGYSDPESGSIPAHLKALLKKKAP